MLLRLVVKEILLASFLQKVKYLPTEKREGSKKGEWRKFSRIERRTGEIE